jgi:myosin heavy subunit
MLVIIASQAALLHNVEFRYKWDLIYSYVGHLLLAVNPYVTRPSRIQLL